MNKLVKVVLHFFGKSYVPAHKNHKGTMVKAHVRTYQRRSKSGQTVMVQEHEDKRQAARPDMPVGRKPGQEDQGSGQRPTDKSQQETMQTARPQVHPVEPAKPGELESWLLKIEQEPDVQQAMREVAEGTSTHLLYKQEDGSYTPERQRLHDEIIASMLNPRAVVHEGQRPHVAILIGAPASGKTSALQPAVKDLGVEFTVINADDVKAKLPEYNGRNAGLVHEESSDIAEGKLLPKAVQSGHHVLLDLTGANGKKMQAMVERFHKLGYEISVLYAHLPIEKAAARAVERFRRSGRFEPPRYVAMNVDGKPEQTYNELKNDPRVTHYRRYSTDVEKGQQAPLQEHGKREFFQGKSPNFGKSQSVREGSDRLRGHGRDTQRQDSRVIGSSASGSPVDRAERVCAHLRKSLSYLDLDLSSPDLSGAERGVLLAARLDRLEKLEQIESLLEQARVSS